jgi:hypothetical protein
MAPTITLPDFTTSNNAGLYSSGVFEKEFHFDGLLLSVTLSALSLCCSLSICLLALKRCILHIYQSHQSPLPTCLEQNSILCAANQKLLSDPRGKNSPSAYVHQSEATSAVSPYVFQETVDTLLCDGGLFTDVLDLSVGSGPLALPPPAYTRPNTFVAVKENTEFQI